MQPPFHWARRGLVYSATGRHGFDQSHCHKPTPVLVDAGTIRVFFGVRDARNTTRTTYVDLDAADPWRVKYVHDRPVLDTGKLGAFDDSGANVSAICRDGDLLYMYFIGWNPSTTVHTRNAIGEFGESLCKALSQLLHPAPLGVGDADVECNADRPLLCHQ